MIGVVAAASALTPALHAGLISGAIAFAGLASFDTNSAATATAVVSWSNTTVVATSGTFSNVTGGTAASFSPARWNFQTTSPLTNFWSVGGFKFELQSSSILAQGGTPGTDGFVVVSGSGVVNSNGYTPTYFNWSFTSQDPKSSIGPPPLWNFSASANSANSNATAIISSTTLGHALVLSWNDPTFALEAAPMPGGAYTNIPGATSPYTNAIAAPQKFFRLKH